MGNECICLVSMAVACTKPLDRCIGKAVSWLCSVAAHSRLGACSKVPGQKRPACHSPLHKWACLVLPSSQVLPCVAERLDQLIDDATPLRTQFCFCGHVSSWEKTAHVHVCQSPSAEGTMKHDQEHAGYSIILQQQQTWKLVWLSKLICTLMMPRPCSRKGCQDQFGHEQPP